MAKATPQQQTNGQRAAIYARVSDKSQAEDDKTSISEQTSEDGGLLRTQGADHRRPLSGGGPRLVQEAA